MHKIKIIDSTFDHAKYSTDFEVCDFFEWDRDINNSNNDVVIYTENEINKSCNLGKINIAWLIEPNEYKPNEYTYIRNNYHKFDYIFTHDQSLINIDEKFIFIPFGGCWIKKEDRKLYKKIKKEERNICSIIVSNKTGLSGHRLRHEIVRNYRQSFDVYGRGYNPIEYKLEALKDYMFSIVVENAKKDNWFTEKIIDSFSTGTIPIYYGSDVVKNIFNPEGIISFNDLSELDNILQQLNEDLYLSKIDAINENFLIAQKYTIAENFIYNFLKNKKII